MHDFDGPCFAKANTLLWNECQDILKMKHYRSSNVVIHTVVLTLILEGHRLFINEVASDQIEEGWFLLSPTVPGSQLQRERGATPACAAPAVDFRHALHACQQQVLPTERVGQLCGIRAPPEAELSALVAATMGKGS